MSRRRKYPVRRKPDNGGYAVTQGAADNPVDLRAVLMYWGPLLAAIFSAGMIWSNTEGRIKTLDHERIELKSNVNKLEDRLRVVERNSSDHDNRVRTIETKLDPVIVRLDRVERKLDMLICKILPRECKTLTSDK